MQLDVALGQKVASLPYGFAIDVLTRPGSNSFRSAADEAYYCGAEEGQLSDVGHGSSGSAAPEKVLGRRGGDLDRALLLPRPPWVLRGEFLYFPLTLGTA